MVPALDILNEVADRLGWSQLTTIESATLPTQSRKLIRLLNRVLQTLQSFDNWPLLRAEDSLTTVAAIKLPASEYVAATNGSTTLTGQGTTWDKILIGRAISVSSGTPQVVYRIADVASPTQLTLNKAWVGDDVAFTDEVGYSIGMDRYTLPADYDRPCGDIETFLAPYGISAVSPERFKEIRQQRGYSLEIGDPSVFTIHGTDDEGNRLLIHFDPYPESQHLLQFSYQKNHPVIETDADRVLFPRRHQALIIELMMMLSYRDYEDDDRVQQTIADFMREVNRQIGTPALTQDRPRITPSGVHRLAEQSKWGGHGVRGSYSESWDILGFHFK